MTLESGGRKLPDWIEGFLRFMKDTEPPDSYKIWVAVSVIASCLERKCYLAWMLDNVYPNLYIALVGPAGKTRKGTAMGPGLNMLHKVGVQIAAEATTREALIRRLKRASDNKVDLKRGGISAMHSSLTVFSKELTVFLGYGNNQLMSDLCDWFDCGPTWTYETKNMGTDNITGVWVNLIGATTPEVLAQALPSTNAIGGGLASRIIFVYEERKGLVNPRPAVTPEMIALRELLIDDLNSIHIMSGEFKVTDAFMDKWVDWYLNSEANPPFEDPRLDGYCSRRQVHLLKLCMIMSASRSSEMLIGVEDFHRAQVLLETTEKRMPRVFAGIGQSPQADITNRVLSTIAYRGEVKYDELLRIYYHDADTETLRMVLDTLCDMNYIQRIISKEDPRGSLKWIGKNVSF